MVLPKILVLTAVMKRSQLLKKSQVEIRDLKKRLHRRATAPPEGSPCVFVRTAFMAYSAFAHAHVAFQAVLCWRLGARFRVLFVGLALFGRDAILA